MPKVSGEEAAKRVKEIQCARSDAVLDGSGAIRVKLERGVLVYYPLRSMWLYRGKRREGDAQALLEWIQTNETGSVQLLGQ